MKYLYQAFIRGEELSDEALASLQEYLIKAYHLEKALDCLGLENVLNGLNEIKLIESILTNREKPKNPELDQNDQDYKDI